MIHMVPLKFFSFLLAGIFIVGGCSKEATPENNNFGDEDDCVQGGAAGNGAIVEGRYIVLYKSSSVSARGMTAERLNTIGVDVLQRNSINGKKLEESFGGQPGGFIATISSDEAGRLSKDESIAAIEPDRIISLGTCFTVAAPTLVTW